MTPTGYRDRGKWDMALFNDTKMNDSANKPLYCVVPNKLRGKLLRGERYKMVKIS